MSSIEPSDPSDNAPSGPSDNGAGERPRFATGRLLAGRYEVLERIGQGGTAEVFRARDHRLDRLVAIKVLRPQYGQDADARARFGVEARSAAALDVSNIVPVYDFGAADDGSLFIVMRLIEGPSLRQVLAEQGALTAAAAVEIAAQIARALAEAHDHGLLHRDVKPGNILVDPLGTAHLTDFGTVKALAGGADLTRSGLIYGTAAYLSPEQATGGTLGPRTDLYSLGVVLYEALSGRAPFSGDDAVAVSYQHAHQPPPQLSTLVPDVDTELAALVMTMLEKDPDLRPASARDVAVTLEAIGRRLASQGATAIPLIAGTPGSVHDVVASADPPEPDKATTVIPAVTEDSSTVVGAPVFVATAAAAAPPQPPLPIERGVVPQTRARRPADARRGSAAGPALLVLALGAVALVSIFLIMRFLSAGDNGVAGVPTASPRASVRASVPVVVGGPTIEVTPVPPVITPVPSLVTAEPSLTTPETPQATPVPPMITPEPPLITPVPPVITPEPPAVTPEPPPITPEPPQVTPEPPPITPEPPPVTPPPAQPFTVRVDDTAFSGDYPEGNGRYHGRSASWVYGQGTAFHTMTADFSLPAGQLSGPASLEITGLDGENPLKNGMRVVLNGTTIYEGPNPLPNDTCCGPSGPGNWGSARFDIPDGVLAATNSLVITNMEANDCTLCPKFVMVDFVDVAYSAQP